MCMPKVNLNDLLIAAWVEVQSINANIQIADQQIIFTAYTREKMKELSTEVDKLKNTLDSIIDRPQ